MTGQRPVFVLVPGAWHLPSTWDLLRGELDALGYASRAVKLPTAGPDAYGGLREDADAIHAAIEQIGGPVVAVGHSYGGIPLSEGGADLPNLRHLVYLSAYLPDVGESMYILHGHADPDPETTRGLYPKPADPRAQLYGDVPDAVAELALSRLTDQRHQPWADHTTKAAWRTVPSTYVISERDASVPLELQEKMAARANDLQRMPTSHSPFLSRPAELAKVLDEVARRYS
jgi:pimeloyl-ACP methyl ester carboxylesterase